MLQVVLPEGSKNPQPVVPFVAEQHLEVIGLCFLTLISDYVTASYIPAFRLLATKPYAHTSNFIRILTNR